MGPPRVGEFPYVPWRAVAERNGVELREHGSGAPLVFVPGMTGGGQATLELCLQVAEQAAAAGKPHRVLLVDYTREEHETFDALRDTIEQLVRPALGRERTIVWTESLGCLAAPPPRFDATLNVKKRVMISAFGGVPQFPLRLGLIAMALSPSPIYRWVMGPMGRWLFGPTGDRPGHIFFDSVAKTPPRVSRRRSGWLKGKEFYDLFEASTVPTKLWLGSTDRLVDIKRERAFFTRLAAEVPGFELSVVEGGGHVVTDTALLAKMLTEVTPWVIS
jgi:pimeloyl-ACP methyl ester carboxylesterase